VLLNIRVIADTNNPQVEHQNACILFSARPFFS